MVSLFQPEDVLLTLLWATADHAIELEEEFQACWGPDWFKWAMIGGAPEAALFAQESDCEAELQTPAEFNVKWFNEVRSDCSLSLRWKIIK